MTNSMTSQVTSGDGLRLPSRIPAGEPGAVPFGRLVRLELRKLIDTRAGRWLLAAIGLATLAIVVILMFTGTVGRDTDFRTFLAATSIPQGILLPILGVMTVTAEWSQRTGLVTFTLEPRRLRVAWSKLVAACLMGLVAILAAVVLAAAATALTELVRGGDPAWWNGDTAEGLVGLVVAQLVGVAIGVAFGMLIQNTPGAIVAYLFIPTVWSMVSTISWMQTVGEWADTNQTLSPLIDGNISGMQWAHLAVSVLIWVVVPLTAGMWRVTRSEVKSA